MDNLRAPDRLVWVDIAKGMCIALVVIMHSAYGVEKAVGAPSLLHGFVEWARPFRMPDFFLISGLFLAARIGRPWRSYLDTKVVHFVYFYVLWLTIQFVLKAPALAGAEGVAGLAKQYAAALVEPWGTLWFIYLLAVFFTLAKLAEALPRGLVWIAAALLHIAAPATGWLVLDEVSSRFVFFYAGYLAADWVLEAADRLAGAAPREVVGGLALWAVFNTAAVASGLAFVPGVDLAVSFAGIGAVVALSTLIARYDAGSAVAYLGRNSISIYLAFPLFMAPTRVTLLGHAGWLGPEIVSLLVAGASLAGALALGRAVKDTRLGFLFERPAAFRLISQARRPQAPSPACARAAEASSA